ncbi:hypothetical protein ACT3UJ_06705 [Halomonas sp. 86]|uniref:hypothetical protein n=1 Tax=unclassified Halomonas TaxID=2609666 RepID=UPI004033F24E
MLNDYDQATTDIKMPHTVPLLGRKQVANWWINSQRDTLPIPVIEFAGSGSTDQYDFAIEVSDQEKDLYEGLGDYSALKVGTFNDGDIVLVVESSESVSIAQVQWCATVNQWNVRATSELPATYLDKEAIIGQIVNFDPLGH